MNVKTTAVVAAVLAALAAGCSSGTSSAPRPSASAAPPAASSSPSASALIASAVVKADGYAVSTTNPHPQSYEQSAACGVRGTAAEEAVVVRTDANSQAAVSSFVATLEQDTSAMGITVAYAKPVIRIRGTLTALDGSGVCSWAQSQQSY